jgi:hypothetical protein
MTCLSLHLQGRALGAVQRQDLPTEARRLSRRNCHLTRIERLVNVRPGTARALVEWRDDRSTGAGANTKLRSEASNRV